MRYLLLLSLTLALTGCKDRDLTIYPSEFIDVFEQRTVRQVDVLLVVDNSGSMVEEQAKLADNFESFIESFVDADVDYHIGVTTTDINNVASAGHLRETDQGTRFISQGTEDAATQFAQLVNVGTEGSGLEAGLEAARMSLSEPLRSDPEGNGGFYRPEAALSVVIFSDENDLSPLGVEDYLNFFAGLKGVAAYRDHTLANVSAVAGDVPFGCEAEDGSGVAAAGTRYADASTTTNGVFASICAQDFSPIVKALGLNVSGLRSEFPLTFCPRPESLVVAVDAVQVTEGWTYAPLEKLIRFNEDVVPPPLSTVEISYQFLPENTTSCPVE